MTLERIRLPEQLPEPISHFTDAVVADGWLWMSGIIAVDKDGKLVGGDDVVAQTQRVFENISAVLKAAGADFEDVVKVTVYLRRIDDRAAINAVRRRFFGESRPASTLVEVSALAVAEALIEVEAVARLPKS
ncbi:MAG TPA: RidA family protein [Candidatus Limnocylindria bacterium]|nr:RidA family protein [Candidatus Limnocylindria bacterium]